MKIRSTLLALFLALQCVMPAFATEYWYSASNENFSPVWRELDAQDWLLTYLTPYDNGAAHAKTLELVNSAERKIRVCAYGFTDAELSEALIAAKNRGVDVSIVMDSTQAAGRRQALLVKIMRANGIEVATGKSEVRGQLIHAKFIVVDDLVVESGSWNYSGQTASAQANHLDFIKSKKRAQMFGDFWDKIHDHVIARDKIRKHH